MTRTTFPLAAVLILLTCSLLGSSASAQADAALKDIQKQPAELLLFPFLANEQAQFETHNGMLLLTQQPAIWSGSVVEGSVPEPPHHILWSGKLGTEPLRFTVETSKTEEDLKDGDGKIVCSQHFEEPSLTLDFSQPNQVALRDNAGQILGSSAYREPAYHQLAQAIIPPLPARRPDINISLLGNIRIETDTKNQQTAVFSGDQLIWSGHRPSNDGIRYGVSPDSPVSEIPARQFPVGSIVALEVAREIDTARISDSDHHLSETLPVDTLHLTASCSDESVRKNIRNWFVFFPHTKTDDFSLTAPGTVDVEIRTAGGEWISREVLKAAAELQKVAWSRKPQTRLTLTADIYDKNGSKVETQPMGWQYLPQN